MKTNGEKTIVEFEGVKFNAEAGDNICVNDACITIGVSE